MSPPDQCAKREFVDAIEVFGAIEVLIRKILQVLAFHQLMDLRIEVGRRDERQTGKLLL